MSYIQYPDLAGKVVFISGGSSGIGAELVLAFAAQGSKVCFCGTKAGGGDGLMAQIKESGQGKWPVPRYDVLDVRDIPALTALLTTIGQQVGPIAVLVNNAGRDDRHSLENLSVEEWDDCINVNLRHQVFAAKAVMPQMKAAGGGSIINMGSISWMRGRPNLIGYTSSKAAIYGMTRSMARELGVFNIRVNGLVPGAVVTQRQNALWRNDSEDAQFLELQCLKYRLNPVHVARSTLFLASNQSDGITGHNLIVDAGLAQVSVMG